MKIKAVLLLAIFFLIGGNLYAAGDLIVDGNLAVSGNFNLLPAGTIVMFAGTTAPPEGWLICNGDQKSRTDYATLYAAIGTTFGVGNGSTTFNLPDMRGRIAVGAGTGMGGGNSGSSGLPTGPRESFLTARSVGNWFGEERHALNIAEIPSHTHTQIGAQAGSYWGSMPWLISGGSVSGIQTGAAGSGAAHNNLQPSLVVNYIIKY